MDQAVAQAGRQGLISDKPEGVVDATGLSADGRSSYYAHKLQRSKGSTHGGSKSTRYPMLKWPKINAIADTHSHLFIAASVSEGPSHDSPELPELLEQASGRVKFDRFLADAGYDSEEHHRLALKGRAWHPLNGDRPQQAQPGPEVAQDQVSPPDEAKLPYCDLWESQPDRKHLEPPQAPSWMGVVLQERPRASVRMSKPDHDPQPHASGGVRLQQSKFTL